MRGVAAAAVAVYHFRREAAPQAYLAVDFFFALSGFVLAKAYGARLVAGASVLQFVAQRVVRLYPLFLAGIGFGLLWRLAQAVHSPAGVDWLRLAGSAVANLLMLPSPFDASLYPFDYAFWSIGMELFVNVLFAAWLVSRSRMVNLAVVMASAAVLLIVIRPPLFANGGVGWETLHIALARTLFSFTLGTVLAGVIVRREALPPLAAVPLVAVLCAMLLARPGEGIGRAYDLLAIVLVFPVLLGLGALVEPPRHLRKLSALLGDLSYPLYAVHAPIGLVFFYLGWRFDLGWMPLLAGYLLVATSAAVVTERWWDRPARRGLAARLAVRRSAEPSVL